MKLRRFARWSHQSRRLGILLLACVLLVVMAAACGGGGEEKTPTATATAARTGTATATPTPPGQVCGPAARQATIKPGPPPGITDTEIKLGAEFVLSGATAAVYATLAQATNAYFNYINDTEGGVCGRKIVWILKDNQEDPAKALEAARYLVEQEKVFAMVGSLGDGAHPGAWDWLNENGVPDTFVSAGGARFGADPCGHPWEVQMIPSYTIDGTFLAQYITENHPGQTVAVLWENDVIGQDGFAGVKQGLDPNNNPIVADQSYENTSISLASPVANLAKTKADVLVINGNLGFVPLAVKAAVRLGWHPQFVFPYIASDDMVFQFAGDPKILEGAVSGNANKMARWRDTDPAVAKHWEIMNKYDGPSPTNFTIYAQILAEVAVEALKRSCDNLTREGFMEAIESIKNFHSDLALDGVNFSFSPTDHVAYQSNISARAKLDENGQGYWEYFGPLRQFEGIQ